MIERHDDAEGDDRTARPDSTGTQVVRHISPVHQAPSSTADAFGNIDAGMGEGPLRAAQKVGRYEVIRILGRGGMGIVYLARDPVIERACVLKTLSPELATDPSAVERLRRESRIAGALRNDGICGVLDYIEHEGRSFVVMPYIEGTTLAKALADRTAGDAESLKTFFSSFTTTETERSQPRRHSDGIEDPEASTRRTDDWRPWVVLLEKVARSLNEAHEAGIIHRDLKPANIMVTTAGRPVILDFGVALTNATRFGGTEIEESGHAGTPAYMAPEQVRGHIADIDRRTDVHALGVILYEIIANRRPYAGSTRDELFESILSGRPTPPRAKNSAVPTDLEAVCLKAMRTDPASRYTTAREFADDLAAVIELRPTIARPPTILGRISRSMRRRPQTAAAVCLAIVALGATALFVSKWRTTNRKLAVSTAVGNITLAALAGREISAEDFDLVLPEIADAHDRERFKLSPVSAESLAVLRNVSDRNRPTRSIRSWEPIAPRGGIFSLRPTFSLYVPDDAEHIDQIAVEVRRDDGEIVTWPIPEGSIVRGRVVSGIEAPIGQRFAIDRIYSWRVTRPTDAVLGDASVSSESAQFATQSADIADTIRSGLPQTTSRFWNGMLYAGALLVRGFAAPALEVLDDAGPAPTEDAEIRRLRIRAASAHYLSDTLLFDRTAAELARLTAGRR